MVKRHTQLLNILLKREGAHPHQKERNELSTRLERDEEDAILCPSTAAAAEATTNCLHLLYKHRLDEA